MSNNYVVVIFVTDVTRKGVVSVSALKKTIIVLALIVGVLAILAFMKMFEDDYRRYPKVFYEYKEKGKSIQFKPEDVERGFK